MNGHVGPNAFQTNCSACTAVDSKDKVEYVPHVINTDINCICACEDISWVKVYKDDEKNRVEFCRVGTTACISPLAFIIMSVFGGVGTFAAVIVIIFGVLIMHSFGNPF